MMKDLGMTARATGAAPIGFADVVQIHNLWCCACGKYVDAKLTSGSEVYPHRPDLADVPRWKCDGCGNHVGTHHKTNNPTRPLGNIPSEEIKRARIKIHELIDPPWKSGQIRRGQMYGKLSKALGYEYHTGEIKTIEEARNVYRVARTVLAELNASRDCAIAEPPPSGAGVIPNPESQ